MSEGDRATGAAYNVATLLAADLAGISSAIEEDYSLAVIVVYLVKRP
jgi:hypothetical protein